jgi:hypothetical protein
MADHINNDAGSSCFELTEASKFYLKPFVLYDKDYQ